MPWVCYKSLYAPPCLSFHISKRGISILFMGANNGFETTMEKHEPLSSVCGGIASVLGLWGLGMWPGPPSTACPCPPGSSFYDTGHTPAVEVRANLPPRTPWSQSPPQSHAPCAQQLCVSEVLPKLSKKRGHKGQCRDALQSLSQTVHCPVPVGAMAFPGGERVGLVRRGLLPSSGRTSYWEW